MKSKTYLKRPVLFSCTTVRRRRRPGEQEQHVFIGYLLCVLVQKRIVNGIARRRPDETRLQAEASQQMFTVVHRNVTAVVVVVFIATVVITIIAVAVVGVVRQSVDVDRQLVQDDRRCVGKDGRIIVVRQRVDVDRRIVHDDRRRQCVHVDGHLVAYAGADGAFPDPTRRNSRRRRRNLRRRRGRRRRRRRHRSDGGHAVPIVNINRYRRQDDVWTTTGDGRNTRRRAGPKSRRSRKGRDNSDGVVDECTRNASSATCWNRRHERNDARRRRPTIASRAVKAMISERFRRRLRGRPITAPRGRR